MARSFTAVISATALVALAAFFAGADAAAAKLKLRGGDWLGTHSLQPGVRNVMLQVEVKGESSRVKSTRVDSYGMNFGPLPCDDGRPRTVQLPRYGGFPEDPADDLLFVSHRNRQISKTGRFTDNGTFVKLFHVSPPVKVTYELSGKFRSSKEAKGTARATAIYDTRGDWLEPTFKPENVTTCSGQASWKACFASDVLEGSERAPCFGKIPEGAAQPLPGEDV